jgi:hypothetical protein
MLFTVSSWLNAPPLHHREQMCKFPDVLVKLSDLFEYLIRRAGEHDACSD